MPQRTLSVFEPIVAAGAPSTVAQTRGTLTGKATLRSTPGVARGRGSSSHGWMRSSTQDSTEPTSNRVDAYETFPDEF
jgi:hypothetical protein